MMKRIKIIFVVIAVLYIGQSFTSFAHMLARYSADAASFLSPPWMNIVACYKDGIANGIHIGEGKNGLSHKVFQSELALLTWEDITQPYVNKSVAQSTLSFRNPQEFQKWLRDKDAISGKYPTSSRGVRVYFAEDKVSEVCVVKVNIEAV